MRTVLGWLIFTVLATRFHCARLVGGWTQQDNLSNPRFFALAHMSLSGENKAHGIPGAAIRLRNVATQVVAGIKYKIQFDLVPLVCSSNKIPRVYHDGSYRGHGSLLCVMGVVSKLLYDWHWFYSAWDSFLLSFAYAICPRCTKNIQM